MGLSLLCISPDYVISLVCLLLDFSVASVEFFKDFRVESHTQTFSQFSDNLLMSSLLSTLDKQDSITFSISSYQEHNHDIIFVHDPY